ncbi:hypothetical protein FCIRC_563 [Fusarium circinatum]|uniref:DUF7730 domain-containing protein n=1 Tax=Fusarium circinatum TaxID=48490 RepID=A0A8H6CT44_FUSCI|nr:hypothetical protein FCIRC_563 [Fusarium circinatum]
MMRSYPLPPGLPFMSDPPLPSSHDGQPRRLLTPEPPQSGTVATGKANGAFFDRLPTEIRTRILRLAFGDRTVHVDLICGYPIFPDSKRHGGLRQLPYYREGIHVLYATNTFHTASKEMILNIHDFFQQQRLNAITSVEIVWEFTPWILPDISEDFRASPPLSDIETFRQFLKTIPKLFLNIKKLYVSLQGDMIPKSYGQISDYKYSTKERIELVEKNIILKVDQMVPYLKPHVDFSIAYPTSTYAVQRSLAHRQGWTVKQRHETGEVERHWRPLAKCQPRTGYWVCLGDKDVRKKRARGIIGHKHMPARVSETQYEVFFRS